MADTSHRPTMSLVSPLGPSAATQEMLRAADDPLRLVRLAFNGAANGVIVCGDESTILFANRSATDTFSYAPGELVGYPLSRVIPEVPLDPSADAPEASAPAELP